MRTLRITVAGNQSPERLDVFLSHQIENISRARVQQLIEKKYVLVNQAAVVKSYIVRPKDVIDVLLPLPERVQARPENIPIPIVYEDDDLVIVNKPAGMVVHPAYSNYSGTMVNALLYHIQDLSGINGEIRPGIVHRIDKDTSGLLLVAKHDRSHRFLSQQFRSHQIEREYQALVWGRLRRKAMTLDAPIGRNPKDRKKFAVVPGGKPAITHYELIEQFEYLALIRLKLETGRTHQIRVHMASLGHPVFGDRTYGGDNPNLAGGDKKRKMQAFELLQIMPRQALHAKTLGFIHPSSRQPVRFDSELPDDFLSVLKEIKKAKG